VPGTLMVLAALASVAVGVGSLCVLVIGPSALRTSPGTAVMPSDVAAVLIPAGSLMVLAVVTGLSLGWLPLTRTEDGTSSSEERDDDAS
jgi:hypothetical protein